MKIASVVGARPQFIKAAALSRELRKRHEEILIHTGQHYDHAMSGVFFDGLEIPAPDINLGVGSGRHGAQTGAMLSAIEEVLVSQRPERVLVYGDTNSTLAGALAASKLHLPIVHVEAGLRSFNWQMPEEINRVLADRLSDLLLCPSETAVINLKAEGITRGVHVVGDVMQDVLNWAKERADAGAAEFMDRMALKERQYLVATIHRSENTDDPERLEGILRSFKRAGRPVIFPAHPRTLKMIGNGNSHQLGSNVTLETVEKNISAEAESQLRIVCRMLSPGPWKGCRMSSSGPLEGLPNVTPRPLEGLSNVIPRPLEGFSCHPPAPRRVVECHPPAPRRVVECHPPAPRGLSMSSPGPSKGPGGSLEMPDAAFSGWA